MIFLALTFAALFAGSIAITARAVRQSHRERQRADDLTRERDRLRSCRWAMFRPLSTTEIADLARSGHRPCYGRGRIVVDGASKSCGCIQARWRAGVEAGRFALAPGGTMCAVEPVGIASAVHEAAK